jgi:hypothetical protein
LRQGQYTCDGSAGSNWLIPRPWIDIPQTMLSRPR